MHIFVSHFLRQGVCAYQISHLLWFFFFAIPSLNHEIGQNSNKFTRTVVLSVNLVQEIIFVKWHVVKQFDHNVAVFCTHRDKISVVFNPPIDRKSTAFSLSSVGNSRPSIALTRASSSGSTTFFSSVGSRVSLRSSSEGVFTPQPKINSKGSILKSICEK